MYDGEFFYSLPRIEGSGDSDGAGQADNHVELPDLEELAWELAGVSGLDPEDRTLRELWWAAQGRGRLEWDQTAGLMSVMNSFWGKRPINPDRLNPYRRRRKAKTAEQRKREWSGTMSGLRALVRSRA